MIINFGSLEMLSNIFKQKFNFHQHYFCEGKEKVTIKPTELDIYYEPPEKEFGPRPPPSPAVLYEYVSSTRKQITTVFSGLLTTHEKISNMSILVKQKIRKTYEQTMEDPYYLLSPAAILLAFMSGAAVAGKGRRPVKRTLYAVVFGTAAASVTYPQRALDIATTGYYHTSGAVSQILANVSSSETVTEKAPEGSEKAVEDVGESFKEQSRIEENVGSDEGHVDVKSENVDVKDVDVDRNERSVEAKNENFDDKDERRQMEFKDSAKTVEGDIGQSNPEDADMYTTRS